MSSKAWLKIPHVVLNNSHSHKHMRERVQQLISICFLCRWIIIIMEWICLLENVPITFLCSIRGRKRALLRWGGGGWVVSAWRRQHLRSDGHLTLSRGGGGLKRVADSLAAPLLVTGRASRIPADIRYTVNVWHFYNLEISMIKISFS